jgi:glycerate dehydrogenase
VANVANYSTDAVAQLSVSMALSLALHLRSYDDYVKSGQYFKDEQFSYFGQPFHNLSAMTWGILGLGNIGHKVAEIATSFGCRVIYTSLSGHDRSRVYERVNFDELLRQSDILSIHCPLTPKSENLFDDEAFKKMKTSSILINTARGAIVNEEALKKALNAHEIYGAGLDAFKKEPLPLESPLYKVEDQHRLIMTPHVGWGSFEARDQLVKEVYLNIKAYLNGENRNIVNDVER